MLHNMQELDAMVQDDRLRPRFSESFALEDFADAFRVITERRVRGKVVLTT